MTADLNDHRASSMVPSGTNENNAFNDPLALLARNGPVQNVFLAQNSTGLISGLVNFTCENSGQQQSTQNVFVAGKIHFNLDGVNMETSNSSNSNHQSTSSGSTENQKKGVPSVVVDMKPGNQQNEENRAAQEADDYSVAPRSISDIVRVMPNGILFHIYLPFRLIVPLYNRLLLRFGFYGPK